MQNDPIFVWIYGFFDQVFAQPLRAMGIPLGPGDYFLIFYTLLFVVIIGFLVRRSRKGGGVPEGVKTIIASTGDVSAGMTGIKKVDFLRNPSEAIVFLKIEENAIQQALMAVDYYAQQGEIDEAMKAKLISLYQGRLEAVKTAIAKEADLKDIVDTSTAVDRARSDYLRKMAAMSGTTVETDSTESGPPSVGTPGAVSDTPAAATPTGGAPSGAPPGAGTPPSGGPPGGAPPGGGAPSGGPPGGGAPPGGGPPSGGPPGGGPPGGGAPSDGAPSGGPPGGTAPDSETPSGGPPGGGAPPGGGPPGGAAPAGGAPSGTAASSEEPKSSGGKSTLQAEMLAEMERLRALMSGD